MAERQDPVFEGLLVGALFMGLAAILRSGRRSATPTPPPPRSALYTTEFTYGMHDLLDQMRLFAPVPVEELELPPPGDAYALPPAPPDPVFFKPGEPQRLAEYSGQVHIVQELHNAVRALAPHELAIRPQLFLGFAGSGKTLLAKVVAQELRDHAERSGHRVPPFLEIFPADISSVEDLDTFFRRVVAHPGAVVFIDEVHGLAGVHSHKLYEVLENGRYHFKDDASPTILPPTTLLAATTDYGSLHAALQRRWIKHFFKPATADELFHYVTHRPFPIDTTAARMIVDRTHYGGAPWEAIELYELATVAAKARQSPIIEMLDVEGVFRRHEIDVLGLRWIDREVIRALFAMPRSARDGTLLGYFGSEQNVVAVARVDKEEYRQTIRPKLLARRLLDIRPQGQTLTTLATETYAHLKPV